MRIRIALEMPSGMSRPHIDLPITPRLLARLCNNHAGKSTWAWSKTYPAILQITSDTGEIYIQGRELLAAIQEAQRRGLLWRDITEAIRSRYESGSEVS